MLVFHLFLCMQILDTNPQLFFHLQQQRLIELIRNGKVEEALEFAQEELAPRGEENVKFCSYCLTGNQLFYIMKALLMHFFTHLVYFILLLFIYLWTEVLC